MKDWTGNKKTTFVTLGASNHSDKEREINDYYATNPNSLEIFLQALDRDNIKLHNGIWECACGEGQARRKLFNKYPPKYVYVNSYRQLCFPNGDMTKRISSASCYCWFIWEKGFVGEPTVRWI